MAGSVHFLGQIMWQLRRLNVRQGHPQHLRHRQTVAPNLLKQRTITRTKIILLSKYGHYVAEELHNLHKYVIPELSVRLLDKHHNITIGLYSQFLKLNILFVLLRMNYRDVSFDQSFSELLICLFFFCILSCAQTDLSSLLKSCHNFVKSITWNSTGHDQYTNRSNTD